MPRLSARVQAAIIRSTKTPLPNIFDGVTEVFIAGGGGNGRALPAAFQEAARFGLSAEKIKVICATSVGAIMGLAMTLRVPLDKTGELLNNMPTSRFQDWSVRSVLNFFRTWGLCRGIAMPAYFRELIREKTGLEDPTFEQLYEAGYTTEFRVVTANVTRHKLAILSYKNTPHIKVAQAVALACSVPFLFPPVWLENKYGIKEAYTDAGIMRNFPWREGSQETLLSQQLGFAFINQSGGAALRWPVHNLLVCAKSFGRYLIGIVSLFLFGDIFSLPGQNKARVVAINVVHNPINFNANPEEQRALDHAGQDGVRNLVRHILHNRANEIIKEKRKPYLPAYGQRLRGAPIVPDVPAIRKLSYAAARRLKL